MLDFTEFYDDTEFVYSLYKKGLLSNSQLFEISDLITNRTDNDSLIQILLLSRDNDKVSLYFDKYLETLNIDIQNYDSFIIKRIFYYILNKKIELYKGLGYIYEYIVREHEYKKTIGDVLGVDSIMVNYILIDDCDITDPIQIQRLETEIKKEMEAYIKS
jgi:hypothetical protein